MWAARVCPIIASIWSAAGLNFLLVFDPLPNPGDVGLSPSQTFLNQEQRFNTISSRCANLFFLLWHVAQVFDCYVKSLTCVSAFESVASCCLMMSVSIVHLLKWAVLDVVKTRPEHAFLVSTAQNALQCTMKCKAMTYIFDFHSIKTFFVAALSEAFIGQICVCVCVSKSIGPFVSCRDIAEGARTEAKYTSWYGMAGSWPLTPCPHDYLYCNTGCSS